MLFLFIYVVPLLLPATLVLVLDSSWVPSIFLLDLAYFSILTAWGDVRWKHGKRMRLEHANWVSIYAIVFGIFSLVFVVLAHIINKINLYTTVA